MGDGGEEGLLDAGLIKDEYVLDYVWSADGLTVAWEHQGHLQPHGEPRYSHDQHDQAKGREGHHGYRAVGAQAPGGDPRLMRRA
jgi:hypothetical protein